MGAASGPSVGAWNERHGSDPRPFTLANPSRPELSPLADCGALRLCIPEHLAIQLRLVELERRDVILAAGNGRCFTGAMVLGNAVLLGEIPMEDMELVWRPQLRSVEVNPKSPNNLMSVAMGAG